MLYMSKFNFSVIFIEYFLIENILQTARFLYEQLHFGKLESEKNNNNGVLSIKIFSDILFVNLLLIPIYVSTNPFLPRGIFSDYWVSKYRVYIATE